jgi:hypothetical protein
MSSVIIDPKFIYLLDVICLDFLPPPLNALFIFRLH